MPAAIEARVSAITHRLLHDGDFSAAFVAAVEEIAQLQAERDAEKDAAVHVGDRMRFDTNLLAQIHAGPDHRSQLVEVARIDRDAEGAVLLLLTAVG